MTIQCVPHPLLLEQSPHKLSWYSVQPVSSLLRQVPPKSCQDSVRLTYCSFEQQAVWEVSSAHGTLLLLAEHRLDAFFAEDVAAFSDGRFGVRAVHHVFEANGTLVTFGCEFVGQLGVEGVAESTGLVVGIRVVVVIVVVVAAPAVVHGRAEFGVEDLACRRQGGGELVDGV